MSDDVQEMAGTIKKILRSDRDFILCLSGRTGEGKSTLSVQLGKGVDANFSISNNITYSRSETIKKIKTLPRYSCLVIDEAINILFKRDFMTYGQKELLKLFDMCRDRNLCIIFNIPYIWSLDTHILHSRLRAWIYIEKRGLGALFMPDKNPFAMDSWYRRHNEKSSKKDLTKSKNFVKWIHFPKLSSQDFAKYLDTKAAKKAKLEEEERKDYFSIGEGKQIVKTAIILYTYWLRDKEFLPFGNLGKIEKARGIKQSSFSSILSTIAPNIRDFVTPLVRIKKGLDGEDT